MGQGAARCILTWPQFWMRSGVACDVRGGVGNGVIFSPSEVTGRQVQIPLLSLLMEPVAQGQVSFQTTRAQGRGFYPRTAWVKIPWRLNS